MCKVRHHNCMKRKIYYKGMQVNLLGIPVWGRGKSRVKKENRKKAFYYRTFRASGSIDQKRALMLMYDIGEDMKKERDWFRRQLLNYGFEMIQKSVWVGSAPLDKDFVKYLNELGLGKKIKFFKLAKAYDNQINYLQNL